MTEAAAFQRQVVMEDWEEAKIRDERCFVVGCGGVGSVFSMGLARMGVKKLTVLDKDVVDVSNLNRQILFGQDDVGKPKVAAAAEGLRRHCIKTDVDQMYLDAVLRWDLVVEEARRSTAIFNGCDCGGFFDYALVCLAKRLGRDLVSASTYSFNFQHECFDRTTDSVCWACNNRPIFPISADDLMDLDSDEAACTLLAERHRMEHALVPEFVRAASRAVEEHRAERGAAETSDRRWIRTAEEAAVWRSSLERSIMEELRPAKILDHANISFVPRENEALMNASLGSWVGVCVTGTFMALNSWVLMRLGKGVVDWASCSLLPERASTSWPYFMSFNDQESSCIVCSEARRLREDEDRDES